MNNRIMGKEFVYHDDELHKSRTSLTVLDVIFEERDAGNWNVYAVTKRGREQIGTISGSGNWVGSRDLLVTEDSQWVRPFMGAASGASVSADKEEFVAQWKGTTIFVRPKLPAKAVHGEIYVIGGDSLHLEAWLRQSRIWMQLAKETATRTDAGQRASAGYDLSYLNVSYAMAGFSIELLFKCLAWIGGNSIEPVHKIGPFYREFDGEIKAVVDALVIANGWSTIDDFIDYVDEYLNQPHRRYFGIAPSRRFEGLNIKRDDKIDALENVHKGISLAASRFLKSRIK